MLKIGECLQDRYVIREIIGRGGTSVVYAATDKKIQRTRAIKEIEKKNRATEKIWKEEWEMMKKLHHPGLAELFDVIEEQQAIYFIMEYLPGYTLKTLLDKGILFSRKQIVNIAGQICGILSYLHTRQPQVIYQDLKPSNIMIKKNYEVVLIDLGTAREYQHPEENCRYIWGTKGYLAPEMEEGNAIPDTRTDIYSLGIIIYEIFYHKKFIKEEKTQTKEPFDEIIDKCIREDPEERYQNVSEIKKALELTLGEQKRKIRHEKWKKRLTGIFLAGAVLSFAFSKILYVQADFILKRGYEKYYQMGQRDPDREKRITYLKKAVYLDPWKGEGFFALLKEYRENGYTREDYKEFLDFLNSLSYEGLVIEDCFQKNKDYTKFAYEMGIGCYFSWEGSGNKKYSVPWLEIAAEGKNLEKNQQILAEGLYKIAQYHPAIEKGEKLYNGQDIYLQYWEDLQTLFWTEGEETVRKMIEKEVAGQIIHHLDGFLSCGVTRQQILVLLDEMKGEEDIKKLTEYARTLIERTGV